MISRVFSVGDDQLARNLGRAFYNDISHANRLDLEDLERLANVWMIIDRQNEPAFGAGQQLGHLREVVAAKDRPPIVFLAAIIGRIEVKQRAGAIPAGNELARLEPLDHHSGHALADTPTSAPIC